MLALKEIQSIYLLKEKATASFKYEILRPNNIKRYQEEPSHCCSINGSYLSNVHTYACPIALLRGILTCFRGQLRAKRYMYLF